MHTLLDRQQQRSPSLYLFSAKSARSGDVILLTDGRFAMG